MSKTGTTKSRIIRLIGSGSKTLSEISSELGLAPSTVSQHLQELKDSGAIEEVDNPHIRKWKYYRLNPEYGNNSEFVGPMKVKVADTASSNLINSRIIYYLIGAIVIVALAYFAITLSTTGNVTGTQTTMQSSFSAAMVSVPLSLTDPPTVPEGTSSLVVTYSSVGVESATSSGARIWAYYNSSGSVDLMSLVNASQVIGNVSMSENSLIEMVSLKIASAQITINGTTYNVTTPSEQITADVATTSVVNQTNGVLLDFSPTVVSAYANGSTIFILLPSIKAAVVPNPPGSSGKNANGTQMNNGLAIGQRFPLQGGDEAYLNYTDTNISITNAVVTAGNGTASLAISIENNGNRSIDVESIAIVGNETPYIIANQSCGPTIIFNPQNMVMCRYFVTSPNMSYVGGAIGVQTQQQPFGLGNVAGSIGIGNGPGPGAVGYGTGAYSNSAAGASLPLIYYNGTVIANGSVQGGNVSQIGGGFMNGYKGQQVVIFARHINRTDTEVVGSGPMFNVGVVAANNSTWLNALGNDSMYINASAFVKAGIPSGVNVIGSGPILLVVNSCRAIFFTVESNGTLETSMQPTPYGFGPMQIGAQGSYTQQGNATHAGYELASGASYTFTYNGTIAQGPPGFRVSLVPGDTYTVVVQADGRVFQQNVTAG